MTSAGEDPRLVRAFRACEQITRRRARNFYYGLRLTPEPKRSALYALYAWMREADDLVDRRDGMARDLVEAQLDDFETRTKQALCGVSVGDNSSPVWVALSHVGPTYDLDEASFIAMLAGQRADLDRVRCESFDELRRYCEQVASTVGTLCVRIWGAADESAMQFAVSRGIAFQLTNILRDFAEDFDEGRIYLPAEDFHRHRLTPQQVRNWSEPARCERFIREQIDRARLYYDESRPLDDLIEPSCRPVLWAMTEIYRSILEKIARDPGRFMSGRRARLSTLRKTRIALEARKRARATGVRA